MNSSQNTDPKKNGFKQIKFSFNSIPIKNKFAGFSIGKPKNNSNDQKSNDNDDDNNIDIDQKDVIIINTTKVNANNPLKIDDLSSSKVFCDPRSSFNKHYKNAIDNASSGKFPESLRSFDLAIRFWCIYLDKLKEKYPNPFKQFSFPDLDINENPSNYFLNSGKNNFRKKKIQKKLWKPPPNNQNDNQNIKNIKKSQNIQNVINSGNNNVFTKPLAPNTLNTSDIVSNVFNQNNNQINDNNNVLTKPLSSNSLNTSDSCFVCGKSRDNAGGKLFQCSRCKGNNKYCSVNCQRKDWKIHKKICTQNNNDNNNSNLLQSNGKSNINNDNLNDNNDNNMNVDNTINNDDDDDDDDDEIIFFDDSDSDDDDVDLVQDDLPHNDIHTLILNHRLIGSKMYEYHAQVLMEMERDFEAISACQQAIILNNKNGINWLTLSRAELNFGDPFQALKSISKAIEIDYQNDEIIGHYSHVYSICSKLTEMNKIGKISDDTLKRKFITKCLNPLHKSDIKNIKNRIQKRGKNKDDIGRLTKDTDTDIAVNNYQKMVKMTQNMKIDPK